MIIPTVYSDKMVAWDDGLPSPSARKPSILADRIRAEKIPVQWVEPVPVTMDDIKRVHDPAMVDGVLSCALPNGFGTRSRTIADSLLYTNGAMFAGCLLARPDAPAAALVSGFHHADYHRAQMFCTFNGLMVSAAKLLDQGIHAKVAILDCDYHYGNGTDDIIDHLGLRERVWHYSFGSTYHQPEQAMGYIRKLYELRDSIAAFQPGLIMYQAGADAHRDDPLGGVLDDDDMHLRDTIVFKMARDLRIPLVWNLAGGYRVDAAGDMTPVITTHIRTFQAAHEVFGQQQAT